MTHPYVPTPAPLGTTVMHPDDDDDDVAAFVVPMEQKANAIARLEQRVAPGTTGPLIWRHLGVPLADGELGGAASRAKLATKWVGNGTDPADGYPSPSIATTGGDAGSGDLEDRWMFCYLLQLPQGAVLQEVHVSFYVDATTVTCNAHVRRRNYRNAIDPGGLFDGADIPESTFVGAASTIEDVDGGMKRVRVEMTHTVDRSETGYEYCVYVRGTGAARFMPQVLAGFDFNGVDQGAA